MPKVIIFEDEPAALKRLTRLLKELKPNYQIIGDADTVTDGVELLQNHQADLILADIQLADGLSFEIFDQLNPETPVIFITAFDDYAIRAFDHNGIQYLLKPINRERFLIALDKFEGQYMNKPEFEDLLALFKGGKTQYQKRILSKIGTKTKVVEINDIAFVYSENRITKAVTFNGKSYVVDYTLDALMKQFQADQFFKISRQIIVNINTIKEMNSYSSNRIKLITNPEVGVDIIVSKEKTPLFKEWLQG